MDTTRVEALEREVARWRWLTVAALIFALGPQAAGALRSARAAERPRTIEAAAFVVRDEAGLVRATLGTKGRGAGAGLSLYDAQGNHVVGLAFTDGAFLDLIHPTGVQTRVGALASGGGLTVSDAAGRRRLVAGVDRAGEPQVELRDKDGQAVSRR